jgi:hypothetical protein
MRQLHRTAVVIASVSEAIQEPSGPYGHWIAASAFGLLAMTAAFNPIAS